MIGIESFLVFQICRTKGLRSVEEIVDTRVMKFIEVVQMSDLFLYRPLAVDLHSQNVSGERLDKLVETRGSALDALEDTREPADREIKVEGSFEPRLF